MKEDFLERCRQCLITCCENIKDRYDFSNDLWFLVDNFNPCKVLSKESGLQSLYDIIKLTPRIVNDLEVIQSIDDEWRAIPNYYDILMLNVNDETDDFWAKLNVKDGIILSCLKMSLIKC
ncbi:hypothetical protein Zmor_006100 [Zophobas morio]|uniref:Uncharacterized protein n=1 Tax=Zophobas morio TaxID=2755281 RepID=A0AA38IU51_9CUCU|nr:hypothetical protein Zmor_006100 [Zophobas morio]